jgi:hypothetical protein
MWVEPNQDRTSVNNIFALRRSAAAYVSDGSQTEKSSPRANVVRARGGGRWEALARVAARIAYRGHCKCLRDGDVRVRTAPVDLPPDGLVHAVAHRSASRGRRLGPPGPGAISANGLPIIASQVLPKPSAGKQPLSGMPVIPRHLGEAPGASVLTKR